MTAQISNRFVYNGDAYQVIAQEHKLDYSPELHGIEPDRTCTACWKGYYCKFVVENERLYLRNLDVFMEKNKTPISINGIMPYVMGGVWEYVNLNIQIEYSGGIVIGTDFLDSYYVHMGYQQMFAYKTVYELTFDKGLLINVSDYSVAMEKYRQANPNEPRATKDDIFNQIQRLFSLDYKDKWFLK